MLKKKYKKKFEIRISNLLTFTLKVVSWIVEVVKPQHSIHVRELKPLVNSLSLVLKTRGSKDFLEYIKKIRQSLLIHLSGEFPSKRVIGVKVSKEGIPKALGPDLVNKIRQGSASAFTLRLILTVLFSSRALRAGRTPNYDPIINPSKEVNFNIGKYTEDFWKQGLGYRRLGTIPSRLRHKNYHFTTKSGPNGHALYASLADLYTLPDKLVESIKILGGETISAKINTLLACKDEVRMFGLPTEGQSIRKITYFPDLELKVRVIAIGDYWSQTVLKPLHHFVFRILKQIPQDCTFSQGAFVDKIKDWTEFYSIDLTAATDRFPVSVIYQVMKAKFPQEYCDAWKDIMVGYPFDSEIGKINYQVGTPMGFYTSWSNFALTHHYVMYYCARELNIPWRKARYVLLGDDILIGDKNLANKYKEIIQLLGCEFSPLKTHDSKTLCEFAKRYVYKGEEITPFPISSLKESHKRTYLMVNLLCELSERSWAFTEEISSVISKYYELVLSKPSHYRATYENQAYICERIMKVMRGTLPAYDALKSIIGQFSIPLVIKEEEGLGILQSLMVESFADSNPANQDNAKYKGRPLGLLAETLVMRITSLWDHKDFERVGPLAENPHYLPILAAYGLIEEMYVNLSKEARRIDTVGGGDWPLFLRAMALPLDDRIFIQRSSHLVARASSLIGNKVLERLKLIAHYRKMGWA